MPYYSKVFRTPITATDRSTAEAVTRTPHMNPDHQSEGIKVNVARMKTVRASFRNVLYFSMLMLNY